MAGRGMPRRGGARGGARGRWRSDDHFDHDDRGHENTRRVSFKPGAFKKGDKFKKNWTNAAIRETLLEDDIEMCGTALSQKVNISGRGNFRGRGGRLNSPAPRSNNQGFTMRKFQPGLTPWYQVVIPYGAKHDKQTVIKLLLTYIEPLIFVPYCYKVQGNAIIFYVDDMKTAEKLFYADRKMQFPDGYNIAIRVRSATPPVELDDKVKEKMKLVMAKRYSPANRALDMEKFHADQDLVDTFCALFRPMIMLAAIDIMEENIPEIEALNLNNNKLHAIEHLKCLSAKFKSLRILYLSNNRIPYIGALDSLKGLPLEELNLSGNPLVSKIADHDVYVSDVRKKFPKLRKLDGVELPPQIGFDVTEDFILPPFQQSFLVDPSAQELIREFLTQYYAIYDSGSRQPLLDAYHENATMSLCANYMYDVKNNNNKERLNAYMAKSRNLLRVDRESRKRHLRSGKLHIVSFLSELPETRHDLLGFTIDLVVYTPIMMVLTLNGVFQEKTVAKTIRAFHRTLVIVPNAGGFCIQNDMLFITNATRLQERRAFNPPTPVPAPTVSQTVPHVAAAQAAAAAAAQAASAMPPPPPPQPDDAQKLQMATAFGQQTGMNQYWSSHCLQEASWDYQRGLLLFQQVHSEGKIPPEAFAPQ